VDVACTAVVSELWVSELCVAAASNPVGSPPTFDVTGVEVSVGADDCGGVAVDDAAGPYSFDTTAAGATQFRRIAIAPVRTSRVALCVVGAAVRCCAWKKCVGAAAPAACAAGATCVLRTGNRSVGIVNASSA
jgi:hypothetical protein